MGLYIPRNRWVIYFPASFFTACIAVFVAFQSLTLGATPPRNPPIPPVESPAAETVPKTKAPETERQSTEVEIEPMGNLGVLDGNFEGTLNSSWYSRDDAGRKTANGEKFDDTADTAAHVTIDFGTCLNLSNPENQTSVVVRINDRGPYDKDIYDKYEIHVPHPDRQLDVTKSVAEKLGFREDGTTPLLVALADCNNR